MPNDRSRAAPGSLTAARSRARVGRVEQIARLAAFARYGRIIFTNRDVEAQTSDNGPPTNP